MPNILFIDPEIYQDNFKEALLQAGFKVEVHTRGGTAAEIIDGEGNELEKFDSIITGTVQ